MNTPAHLVPEAVLLLEKSVAERMTMVRSDHWFGYPVVDRVVERLERFIVAQPSGRMAGMLIVGESNNGKSHLARRMRQLHPSGEDSTTGLTQVPVMHVDLPSSPDESRLYDELFTSLWQPFRAKDAVSQKSSEVRALLKSLGTRLLFIDEIQNVLGARDDKRRALLDAIRFLSNSLGLTIVCLGTIDAMAAFAANDSIINRFPPVLLPAWSLDLDFRRLLASFERILPFPEPSRLSAGKTPALVHSESPRVL